MKAPPPEPPQSAKRRTRIRPTSVVAAGTLSVVVLVTGVSIAVADNQAAEVPGGGAARFVPADGHSEWSIDNLGVARMIESARSIGHEDLLQLPTQAGSAIITHLGDAANDAHLWRESSLTVAGAESGQNGTQTIDLHRLSADGLSLLVGYGGSVGLTYSPPLLELPADVAPGSSWSSTGNAVVNGEVTYTAQYTASAPSNEQLLEASGLSKAELERCLQTDGGSVYKDASSKETLLDIVETDLWCEGRGRVAIVGTVNGTPVIQGSMVDPPQLSPTRTSAAPPTWSNAEAWATAEVAPVATDPFFGEQQLAISLANPPRRTQSGLIIEVNQNGDDVNALRLDSGAFTREWSAHPGGEIIAVETVGEVTVATTSQRRIVAYSESGARLWEKNSPELILAPPTDAGDGSVILVGLDGTVSKLDAFSGDLAWERKLAADVSVSATVEGDSVVIVDRAGALTGFDRASGETLWTSESGEIPVFAFAADGVTVIAGIDGLLRAYNAADGSRIWMLRYTGFVRAAVSMEGGSLVVTNERTFFLDAARGIVLWSQVGAEDAVTDGQRAVLFDEGAAHLVDSSGTILAEWAIPSLSYSIYRYAVAGRDGFWVFRSYQPAVAVGHP